ncbi:RICIN domain-containing protein [Actinomadura litoris]|uniref:RICIN domain-containing protein n=1 Tax=Actinomadura litoris TaxID=2678616 RepID=UPI001FA6D3DD|nr:RICIN domain-containing protein [Actinomadura litoris]
MRRSETMVTLVAVAMLGGFCVASTTSAASAAPAPPTPKRALAGVQIKPQAVGNQCLDVAEANDGDGALVSLWTCNGSAAQRWSLVNGRIQSDLPSHRCLDVRAGNRRNGTVVGMYRCENVERQQWRFEGEHIVSGLQSMCLSVLDNNYGDGAAAVIWACARHPDQSWETS